MSSTKPIKFISATIGSVNVKTTATVAGFAGTPVQWNASLAVVSQAHSDPATMPVPNFYTGRNVLVGDWVTSDSTGKAMRVASISAQTDNVVTCVLEDVDGYNAMADETGNLDGMVPNGAGIGAYIFELKNNVPLLSNIPAALPGNLAGTDFANNIQSRFAATANVGIDPATGKLDASILPAPVPGGSAGAVKLLSGAGDFGVDAGGVLVARTKGAAGGLASLDVSGSVPASQLSAVLGTATVAYNTLAKAEAAAAAVSAGVAAINAKIGQADGIATLDSTGKVPTAQLPSFVDTVVEYSTSGTFPVTGAPATMYVALDTKKVYRWSGTVYVEITSGGNADTAMKLSTARSISLSGAVTGTVLFDGSVNVSISTTVDQGSLVVDGGQY